MSNDCATHPPHPPRKHAHIGMVRWSRTRDGEWRIEMVRGQFVRSHGSLWRLLLYTGVEEEFDISSWAPFE